MPSYKTCLSSGLPQSLDLSEISDEQIEEAVVRIVECEGPVHSGEILQRIRAHTGLSRMLGKIKQRILDSMASAEKSGKILARGEFYWPLSFSFFSLTPVLLFNFSIELLAGTLF